LLICDASVSSNVSLALHLLASLISRAAVCLGRHGNVWIVNPRNPEIFAPFVAISTKRAAGSAENSAPRPRARTVPNLRANDERRKTRMALFTKAPDKTRDRDNAIVNRDRLAVRLTAAEQSVTTTKNAAQAAALAGDDSALDSAEAAEGAALRRLTTIRAAHAESEKSLALLEDQLVTMADQKLRTATADETNELADALAQAGQSFDISISELVTLTTKAALFIFESRGLEAFSTSSAIEVPAAIEIISALLREHAKMVLNGTAPATLPTPEAPFKPTIPEKPVTRRLFALRAVSWREGDHLRAAQKFTDVDLPPACAARAIKARVCVEMADPARNQTTHNQWPGHPNPESCFNLDGDEPVVDAAAHGQEAVTLHSAFTPVDRGPPFKLRVAAGGTS
jgi:hypothetical protein